MKSLLKKKYKHYKNGIFFNSSFNGYWSNFDEKDQDLIFNKLKDKKTEYIIKKYFHKYYRMIFDKERCVALPFLNIKKKYIGIDYGCMWGNLLVEASKKSKYMVGVDQTLDSLKFVKKRINENKIKNISLINENLRNNIPLENSFDFSIVNGVLEWIPTREKVNLKTFFTPSQKNNDFKSDPEKDQLNFLKMVFKNLKKDGKLYLAIENKFDYQYFLWKRDPHSDLFYTTFLPRNISNIISKIFKKKKYVNYIYSKNELLKILNDVGFCEVKIYAAFPDYRFPKKIISLEKKYKSDFSLFKYEGSNNSLIARIFKFIRKCLDYVIYKKLKLFYFSPSFIIIAKK